jgi:hypothetical protein
MPVNEQRCMLRLTTRGKPFALTTGTSTTLVFSTTFSTAFTIFYSIQVHAFVYFNCGQVPPTRIHEVTWHFNDLLPGNDFLNWNLHVLDDLPWHLDDFLRTGL